MRNILMALTCILCEQSRDYLEQRRLARPVRPQETYEPTRRNVQIHPVQRCHRPIPLHHTGHFQYWRFAHRDWPILRAWLKKHIAGRNTCMIFLHRGSSQRGSV